MRGVGRSSPRSTWRKRKEGGRGSERSGGPRKGTRRTRERTRIEVYSSRKKTFGGKGKTYT